MRTRPPHLLLLLVVVLGLAAGCGGGGITTLPTPLVATLNPSSGGIAGGTLVTIQGADLANPGVGANQVLFGGVPATDLIVVDNETITCKTPPRGAPGVVDVTVVKEGGASTLFSGYTYFPPPTIASVVPNTGTRFGGQPITIQGTGFLFNDAGTNDVRIGNKPVTNVAVVSDTEVTGLTPSSFVEAPASVTVENNNGKATLLAGYVYGGPPPFVTSVTPNVGSPNGNQLVTITGGEFTVPGGPLEVFFGTTASAVVTRINDNTLTCLTPAGTPFTTVDVRVQNNNGPGTLPMAYTYLGAPALTSVVPASGPVGGGQAVSLIGNFFTAPGAGTTQVRFGGVSATNIMVVSDTLVTCTTPAGSLGFVDVEVQNNNGTATLSGAYEYQFSASWDATYGSLLIGSNVDDAYSQFNFGGGFVFPYFGQNQTSVFIGTNGYATFQVGDTDYSYSTADITDGVRRISALFADLYTTGGCYAKQTADRVVLTWSCRYLSNSSSSVLMQVQLHQSGIIAVLWSSISNPSNTIGAVALSPSGTPALNWQDLSTSPSGFLGTETVYESWSAVPDVVPGKIYWIPNAAGGYDVTFTPGTP